LRHGHRDGPDDQDYADQRRTDAGQWRAQQLAAADKSDAIMRDAQKQPGLLAQYLRMQLAYDSNRDRAFQLIFGQYLSWYQTYIGDYNGARSSFSIAQPAQGQRRAVTLNERLSNAARRRRDPGNGQGPARLSSSTKHTVRRSRAR
jgi:hypothetical protein